MKREILLRVMLLDSAHDTALELFDAIELVERKLERLRRRELKRITSSKRHDLLRAFSHSRLALTIVRNELLTLTNAMHNDAHKSAR